MANPSEDLLVDVQADVSAEAQGAIVPGLSVHMEEAARAAEEGEETAARAAIAEAQASVPMLVLAPALGRSLRREFRRAVVGGARIAARADEDDRALIEGSDLPAESAALGQEQFQANLLSGVPLAVNRAGEILEEWLAEQRVPVSRAPSRHAVFGRRVKKQDLADRLNAAVAQGTKVTSDIGANLTTSRLVSLGFLEEFNDRGVETYQLRATIDSKTSEICLRMHGRRFEVQRALPTIRQRLLLTEPDDLRAVDPWWPQDAASLNELARLSDQELASLGMMIPPFHPHCRTVTIRVDNRITPRDVPQVEVPDRVVPAGQTTTGTWIGAAAYRRAREPAAVRIAEVMERLGPEVAEAMVTLDARIAEGTITATRWRDPDSGLYLPERQELHDNIVATVLADAVPSASPILRLTGGVPYSGRQLIETGGVRVGMDRVRQLLPEHEYWNLPLTHEEASELVERILAASRAAGVDVTLQAALRDLSWANQRIASFADEGYTLDRVDVATALREEAAIRAGRAIPEGLYVPPQVIVESLSNEAVFDRLTPLAQAWGVWRLDRGRLVRVQSGRAGEFEVQQAEGDAPGTYQLVPGISIPQQWFDDDTTTPEVDTAQGRRDAARLGLLEEDAA